MTHKRATSPVAGSDSAHLGGVDYNKIVDYITDVDIGAADATDKAKINTDTKFRSGKLRLRNPANDAEYSIVTSAITTDKILTVPLIAADDTLEVQGNKNVNSGYLGLDSSGNLALVSRHIKYNRIDLYDDITSGEGTSVLHIRNLTTNTPTGCSIMPNGNSTPTGQTVSSFAVYMTDYQADNQNFSSMILEAFKDVDSSLSYRILSTQWHTGTLYPIIIGVQGMNKLTFQVDGKLNFGSMPLIGAEFESFKIKDASLAFKYNYIPSTLTADRNITLPVLTQNDVPVFLNQDQTFATNAKRFPTNIMKFMNLAQSFSYTVTTSAITASYNINLPLLTANDTFAFIGATQTITNKDLTSATNTFKAWVNADISASAAIALTKLDSTSAATNNVPTYNGTSIVWQTPAGGGNVSTTSSNTFGAFDQIFKSGNLKLRNPADTFSYALTGAAITADRILNLPLITATDTLMALGLDQLVSQPKRFANNTLKVSNPAVSFNYVVVSSAITASRNITLPLLTADDTFAFTGFNNVWSAAQNLPTGSQVNSQTIETQNNKNAASGYAGLNASSKLAITTLDNTGASTNNVPTYNGSTVVWATPAGSGGSIPRVIKVASSNGDYTTFEAAMSFVNGRPSTEFYKIEISSETFVPTATVAMSRGNFTIEGSGQGVTYIKAASTMTGNTPLLSFSGAVSGSSLPLTANSVIGVTTLTMSTANSATLAAGDNILIRSNKQPDTEFTSIHTGEMMTVKSVNTGTGVVTLTDELNDSYLTADSASVIKVVMLPNISMRGITFGSNAATSSLGDGFNQFIWCKNLTIEDCESNAVWYAGFQLISCINSRMQGCYTHDTQDPAGLATGVAHYGIIIHAACKNVVLDTCQGSVLRHDITMGGRVGTNQEGIVRNVTVTNCTSEITDTAHFDTHQACSNIVFNGCVAIGGIPQAAATGAYGFQVRSPNTAIVGCKVLNTKGVGIYVFGSGNNCLISGTTVTGVKQSNAAGGDAIQFSDSTKGGRVTGCIIQDCEGTALTGGSSGNDDISFVGNTVENCGDLTGWANISFLIGTNILVEGNIFKNGAAPINMSGADESWVIANNQFHGNTSNSMTLVGTLSKVKDNMGYNPVGLITTAFPTSGAGNITNSSQAAAAPASTTVQTNRFTDKMITITGGTVTVIAINGSASVGTSGAFKLGVGDTIAITYSVAPTIRVTAL